ncbi:DNA repair protein RecO (recombination protein O) [Anaerosolibacter carboniphilus]|uniref:DNA repair protein RecO n=1 Tax=Anaerosolibacter carboniphilus TaxID=1417629 RepID=A0A841KWA5_9FIRM|nr:DNA repair protein RecO [Anaerosolibacter carboniphilus]MBB6217914.1 DNA repair protein RecO (recombination protein O) [Anaerosolibacter carboniphilus]
MLCKTDGVVLKQTKFGEGDLILTLFTKKMGKVQAVAKGVRRSRGKFTGSTQLFAYGEFVLFKGRDLYQVSQVDLKESFYQLREDITKLTYGAYILELTESIITEGQTNNRLFHSLLSCLSVLAKMEKAYETVVKAYELKLLSYSGYKPELDRCVYCGKAGESVIKFSSKEGGTICRSCFGQDIYAMRISSTTINVMKYLMNTDLEQIARLRVKSDIMEELNKILKHYISTHLEKSKFKSLQFLDTMKEIHNT